MPNIPDLSTTGHIKNLSDGDPFPTYLTQSEGDARYPTVSSSLLGSTTAWSGATVIAANAETTLTHSSVSTGAIGLMVVQKNSTVKFLVNAETSLVDESFYARIITATGNAARSTSQAKFGTASVAFDGTGDDIRVNLTDAFGSFDWDTTSWVVETWVRFTSTTGGTVLASHNSTFNGSYAPFVLTVSSGTLSLFSASASSSWDNANGLSAGSVSTNTWYHVAIVYDNVADTIKVYLDGVLTRTVSSITAFTDNCKYFIQGDWNTGALTGFTDGIRISIYHSSQSPRYTGAFTPSGTAPTDDGTLWTPATVGQLGVATTGFAVQQESSTSSRFKNLTGSSGTFNLGVIVQSGGTLPSYIRRTSGDTKGGSNTNILIYSLAVESSGVDISYVNSAADGDHFLINTSGVYSISAMMYCTNSVNAMVKANTTMNNTVAITDADIIAWGNPKADNIPSMSTTLYLAAGTKVWVATTGTMGSGDPVNSFSISGPFHR